eukprot:8525040-Alexandrium_andersonii.AAC.1
MFAKGCVGVPFSAFVPGRAAQALRAARTSTKPINITISLTTATPAGRQARRNGDSWILNHS